MIGPTADENTVTVINSYKKLLKTMTYELLQDKESGLYAESPEYVWSMIQDEQSGDIVSWLKE